MPKRTKANVEHRAVARAEEDQDEAGELGDREEQVGRRPARGEELVREEAEEQAAGDAGERVTAMKRLASASA